MTTELNPIVAGDLAAEALGCVPAKVRRFSTGAHHYVFDVSNEYASWRRRQTALWRIMVSPPIIRPAAPADIPAITAIYAHAVTHGTATFEIEQPDEEEMANRFRALAEKGFPYLVAERDGAVEGYAYAGPYRARIAYRYTLENSIYVAPDCHRQGIGRVLMEQLLSEAGARGFRQMVAVIGDSAQVASIALHRVAGFQMVGTFAAVGFKFGRWLDTVMMQRALGDGAATPP